MSVYRDKLLRIDLAEKVASEEPISDATKSKFIGGRGFGIKYLYEEMSPGVDPLGPENKLLFAPGILGGTTAPGFSRWMAITKSPLTGTFARSVGGGKFGAAIKICGFDLIIIENKAQHSSYIYIDSDGAKVLNAEDLWGLDTQETQNRLRERHGTKTHVACIGLAGENRIGYAAIINEKRAAARCGVGAVMGSKNLKAVAINISGCTPPELYDADAFRKIVKGHNLVLKTHARRKRMTHLGTTFMTERMEEMGLFPVKNFREGKLPGIEKISSGAFEKLKTGDYGCYACTTKCGNIFEVKEGPYKGASSEGPEYETIFSFGGQLYNTEIGSLVAADNKCDLYGIDTVSTGVVIGFIMELFERNILMSKDLDGLEARWGNHDVMMTLIDKIAHGDGIGKLLGKGVKKAAEAIGMGAGKYAMHCKGLELPGYEPRAAKCHGLGYATSNIGASHMYGYCRQEISGYKEPREIDRFADEGKGDIAGWNQIKKAREETGILCNFADSNVTPELVGDLYVAATGIQELGDSEFMDEAGERIVCLERCFNVREGFDRKDDTLPQRMLTEPLKNAGWATGQIVGKQDTLLDEYYSYMGYSKKGIPTEERLKKLHLEKF